MSTVVISGEPGSVERLTALLESGDAVATAEFFKGLTEKERRAFVKPLREQLKTANWRIYADSDRHKDWDSFRTFQRRTARTQVPAALAVLGGPATIAKYLRTVQRQNGLDLDRDAIRQVLADRAPDWLPELPDAFAQTLDPQGGLRSLIEFVSEQAGVVPAASRGFVRAWAVQYQWGPSSSEARAAFLAEPRLAELLPLTFDDDENDDLFTDWSAFRKVAVEAVRQGLVPRDAVLDGGIRRLLRGGRLGAMQGQLSFWGALEPTDREIADRISSCISLLSSQNGTVARVFLAAVKQVCDTGLVDLELALEAASIAVTRSEKNVVKTALTWLDALATAHPERTAEIAGHIATAFAAQGADVQERAVKLIGKRAKRLGEADRQRLAAEAEVYLAPDLAAVLAGLLGVEQDSAMDGDVGYPDVAPYVPRPLLPPIASPSELAEAVAVLMHGDPAEAMVFERVLEAFVEFSRTDAAGLKEALTPVAERHHPAWGVDTYPQTPRVAVYKLAEAAARVDDETRRHAHRARVHQLWPRVRKQKYGHGSIRTRTSPSDFLILRAAEIHAALGLPDLPSLVSVPTAANGIIAPDVLATRLRECESKGWVPLEADFHQALLRLPVDCGDVDVSGFTSETGRRFAAWVAGDRIELPAVEMPDAQERARVRRSWEYRNTLIKKAGRKHVSHPETLLELLQGVWTEPEHQYDGSNWDVCWPAIVPAHPDLPAVALAGGVDWQTAQPSAASAVVLAEQDDAVHAGTHDVIGYRMLDPDAPLRASGVDAALVLAARGLLDPARLADALAVRLLADPGAALKRMVPCLRDLANGGAAGQTWGTVAALLPRILPPALPKAPAGTGELLVLGAELAGALKVRVPIEAVTAVAEKKGGSSVANAARRLQGVLAAAD